VKHVSNCVNRCTYSNEFSSPDGKIHGLSELKQPESWSIYGPQIAPALGWIARTWGAVARTCGLGRGDKRMAIDRSNHPWPDDFSYELDELLPDAALPRLMMQMQDEKKGPIKTVGITRAPKFISDDETAA
jgi:hypothetical protein